MQKLSSPKIITAAVLAALALPVLATENLSIKVNGQNSAIHKDTASPNHVEGWWIGATNNADKNQSVTITVSGGSEQLNTHIVGGWGSQTRLDHNEVIVKAKGEESMLFIDGRIDGAYSNTVGKVELSHNQVILDRVSLATRKTSSSHLELGYVYGAHFDNENAIDVSLINNKVLMNNAGFLGDRMTGAMVSFGAARVVEASGNEFVFQNSNVGKSDELTGWYESTVTGAHIQGENLSEVKANQNKVFLNKVVVNSGNDGTEQEAGWELEVCGVNIRVRPIDGTEAAVSRVTAKDNSVMIHDSAVQSVWGGKIEVFNGDIFVTQNVMSIQNSEIKSITGIEISGSKIESSNNLIELTDVSGLTDFVGFSINAKDEVLVAHNSIYLEDVKANTEVIGFAIKGDPHQVQMKNNRIVLVNSDIDDLQGLKWFGVSRTTPSKDDNLGVELQVKGTNHLGTLSGVNSIRFEVATALDDKPMLSVNKGSIEGATVTINTLNSDGKNATLIDRGLTLENVTLKTEGTFGEKVLEVDSLNGLSMNSDAVLSLLNQKTQFNQSVQTLTDARMGAVAMIMQGQDIASSLLHNTDHPLSAFAQMTGNTYRYDWSNGMDLNGGSLTLGAAGQVSEGLQGVAFAQFGWANADTEVSGSRGDSDLKSYTLGAGIRHQTSLPVYVDALATVGMTQTHFKGQFESDKASFDSDTLYASTQLGIGGVVILTPDLHLNLYGHYALTYLDGDRVHLKNRFNNQFESEDLWAHSLRIGTRLSGEVASNAQWYTGVAYERLLHGDIKTSIDNESLDSVELNGNTGVFEAGVSLSPQQASPWAMDLTVKAYVGDRQGVSASASMRYLF